MPGIASTCLGSLMMSFSLMRVAFDGLRGIAIGANAERILPINFEQVGRLVQNVGDRLVIHMLKINKNGERG